MANGEEACPNKPRQSRHLDGFDADGLYLGHQDISPTLIELLEVANPVFFTSPFAIH